MAERPLSETTAELHEEGRPLSDPRPDLGERLLNGWLRDLLAAPYRLFLKPLLRRRSNLIENPSMEAGAAGWTPNREEPEMAKSKRKAKITTGKSRKDKQFYNKLVAANGRTLMVSEGFPDKGTADDNRDAVERAVLEIAKG
jgi:hypothetical protein